MGLVCLSCSCGGEVAKTPRNECASQLAALAMGSCAGTRNGSGEETLIHVASPLQDLGSKWMMTEEVSVISAVHLKVHMLAERDGRGGPGYRTR